MLLIGPFSVPDSWTELHLAGCLIPAKMSIVRARLLKVVDSFPPLCQPGGCHDFDGLVGAQLENRRQARREPLIGAPIALAETFALDRQAVLGWNTHRNSRG